MRPCAPATKPPPPGGEIIEISPTLQSSRPMPPRGIASNPCPLDFDAITSTEAFCSVLQSTEQCLHDNRGVPALFAFRTPAMAFTGLVSDEILRDPALDLLAPVCKRLRLSVSSSVDLGPCAFFLPLQPCTDNEPWFAFIRASGAIGVASLQQQPLDSCILHLGQTMFMIEHCNGLPWTGHDLIKHGDILFLSFQGPVRAGGHHASGPHALAPGPTFEDRCEFAVNTSGWIATDELTFWIQHVQWANPGYAYFAMPVLWDDDNGDFDFGSQVEFAIPNNRLTVIPILLRSHRCAVEVNRASHLVTVVVLGFPGPYFHTVVAAVARLLDFHPSRLAASSTVLPDYRHMCGWVLLDRWIRAAGLQDELPPVNDGFEQVSFGKKALIEDVLVSAIEDWVADNIPTDVWLQPVKLRRGFFSRLARNSMQHDSVTTIRLYVNFVDVQAPLAAPQHPGGFPLRPHPAIPDYHIIRRLLKMRDQPGWLASDELDWILEYPRLVLPQTYFCPPARWCSVTSAFLYFQGLTPDFRHHTSVTWFLIVDGTWVQLDLSVGDAWSTVGLTGLKTLFCYGPPEIFGYIPAFIVHIANLIGLPAHEIQAVPVPFQTPPGMCGWSLLHGFFQRMQLVMPDTPHAFLDILANTRHRELVRVIKGTDFACWENSGVAADTVDFAYDARNGFLCRILEGRTTEAFDCAGGVDDGSSKSDPHASAASTVKANTAQDPWASGDPWAKKPKRLFSTKWEDLLLPDKHPVLDAKGNMLDQTHKLQMSARKAGAVLATKASIVRSLHHDSMPKCPKHFTVCPQGVCRWVRACGFPMNFDSTCGFPGEGPMKPPNCSVGACWSISTANIGSLKTSSFWQTNEDVIYCLQETRIGRNNFRTSCKQVQTTKRSLFAVNSYRVLSALTADISPCTEAQPLSPPIPLRGRLTVKMMPPTFTRRSSRPKGSMLAGSKFPLKSGLWCFQFTRKLGPLLPLRSLSKMMICLTKSFSFPPNSGTFLC